MLDLDAAIARAGTTSMLLVASDFDGTLAEIAARPELARPDPQAIEGIAGIALMHKTHAAVVSGRGLQDLRGMVGPIERLHIVGSHGGQVEELPAIKLAAEIETALDEVLDEARRLAESVPGAFVEAKPMGVAFHYREAGRLGAARAEELTSFAEERPGLTVLHGKMVIEVLPSGIEKSMALAMMRRRVGATCVVFIGDDVTDENVFKSLTPSDVSIKVGEGETAAQFRVRNVGDVASVLRRIAAVRRASLGAERDLPIAEHSLLSDQRTIALVDERASVSWLCLPRVDSPPVFWKILDSAQGASFDVWPAEVTLYDAPRPTQRYEGSTFVLESDYGLFKVTDYFDCTGGRPYQRAGRTDLVRVVDGVGKVAIRFAPKFDFGRTPTSLQLKDDGIVVTGWIDPMVLHSPGVKWEIKQEGKHQAAFATVDLGEEGSTGSRLCLELRYGIMGLRGAPVAESEQRDATQRFWSGWAKSLKLPGVQDDLVLRSALVIKALCHGPSGGIAAAGTTSLPAPIGGARNWDYRYCWPRDSALAAASLVRLGNTGVAIKLLDWLVSVVERCESPDRLRPIYTVAGHELGSEAELSDVAGYAQSRPVRIGNAAAHQTQLDIFGPIVDLVALLLEHDAPATPAYWQLVEAMVGAVALRWHEPDHGIWEIRDFRRHWVYSKVMCWHAVDRAIVVGELMQGQTNAQWVALRDEIKADILANGLDQRRGLFTSAYGHEELDAGVLQIGLLGLLPATDPRFVATVEAIEAELVDEGHVRRYVLDDALPGIEGAFHICTAWLAEALAKMGRADDAERYLARLAESAGRTGLIAEQVEPRTKDSMGNFPQAYSHLGVINAACAIARARKAESQPGSSPARERQTADSPPM